MIWKGYIKTKKTLLAWFYVPWVQLSRHCLCTATNTACHPEAGRERKHENAGRISVAQPPAWWWQAPPVHHQSWTPPLPPGLAVGSTPSPEDGRDQPVSSASYTVVQALQNSPHGCHLDLHLQRYQSLQICHGYFAELAAAEPSILVSKFNTRSQ